MANTPRKIQDPTEASGWTYELPSVTAQTSVIASAYIPYNGCPDGVCAFSYATRINVTIAGQAEMVEGQMVTGGFFATLGVDALADHGDEAPGRGGTDDDPRRSVRHPSWTTCLERV